MFNFPNGNFYPNPYATDTNIPPYNPNMNNFNTNTSRVEEPVNTKKPATSKVKQTPRKVK